MTDTLKPSILFIPTSHNPSLGSNRIWVLDLSYYLTKIGVNCKIGSTNDIQNYDIIIYGKGAHVQASESKKTFPNKTIGIINPEGGKAYNVDFIIVGSIEEQDSLSKNSNVLFFPLIERLFQDQTLKTHEEKKTLRLCFHGHYPHLSKFEPNLKSAINEFSKNQEVELLTIHGNSRFNWDYGRPDIKIIFKKWSINTIVEDIKSCDIGLCPNTTFIKDYSLNYSMDRGLAQTDYILRLKNKSNAGRAFVFHQLGIPVIADLTPSHMHILGNPDNGYIAMSKEGWLNALEKLCCYKNRDLISRNARKEFDRLYNPLDWARRLHNSILNIKHE